MLATKWASLLHELLLAPFANGVSTGVQHKLHVARLAHDAGKRVLEALDVGRQGGLARVRLACTTLRSLTRSAQGKVLTRKRGGVE